MKQRFILLLAGLLALLASCAPPRPAEDGALQIGRASCRERVFYSV